MNSEANQFPSIQGQNLNKVKKTVPDDFVERDLIVILAFQHWHQQLVDESINLLEKKGMDETFNIIEVPTLGESSKLQQMYLDGVMRSAIRNDEIRNRTITVYLNKSILKDSLDIESESTIYWFVVGEGTKDILVKGSGPIVEEDIKRIKNLS